MLFDEEFLGSLANDPIAGTMRICDVAIASLSPGQDWTTQDYANLLEAVTLLAEMAEVGILPVVHLFPPISPTADLQNKCTSPI